MNKNTTTYNPIRAIATGADIRSLKVSDFKKQLSLTPKGFASIDGTAAIAEYKPGKPLPLCRVTGTE